MKRQGLVMLALVLLIGLAPAHAQPSLTAKFHIPFEFVVGDLTLPVGDYTVDYSSRTSELRVCGAKGSPCAVALTKSVQGKPKTTEAEMLFNRYGAKSFVYQLWVSDSDRGREIQKTNYEREVMALGLKTRGIMIAAK